MALKSKTKRKIRLGIIFGGRSAEHEISVRTAAQVMEYLPQHRYKIVPIKISKDGAWPKGFEPERLKKKIDLAFILLHGSFGEDGTIQGMMEMLDVPYTFSGVLASSLAMNKSMMQEFAAIHSIRIPRSTLFRKGETFNQAAIKGIGRTVVVKPNNLGSSVGISIVLNTPAAVHEAVKKSLKRDTAVLIQEYVSGVEVTASVLGNYDAIPLPLIEITPKAPGSTFYDYAAKYVTGGSDHIIPARLSPLLAKKVQEAAVEIHRRIGCRGASRSDFIISSKGEVYFLEINTIPGMTATSLLPEAAKAAGITFPRLLETIIKLAFQK